MGGLEDSPLIIHSSECVYMYGVWVCVTVCLPKGVGLSKLAWVSDCVCVNVRVSVSVG